MKVKNRFNKFAKKFLPFTVSMYSAIATANGLFIAPICSTLELNEYFSYYDFKKCFGCNYCFYKHDCDNFKQYINLDLVHEQ